MEAQPSTCRGRSCAVCQPSAPERIRIAPQKSPESTISSGTERRQYSTHQADDANFLVDPSGKLLVADIPVCAVDELTFELAESFNFGPFPPTQASHAAEDKIGVVVEFLESARVGLRVTPDAHMPLARRLIESRVDELVAQLHKRGNLIFIGDMAEIREDLGARRVNPGPVGLQL